MSDRLDAEITRQCIAMGGAQRSPTLIYAGRNQVLAMRMKWAGDTTRVCAETESLCPPTYRGLKVVQVLEDDYLHVAESNK